MEAAPLACYSMGAINSLIAKITQLMVNHPKIKDLLQDIQSLRDDMNKFAGGQAKGEQVKVWMKQAREMTYDVEDWIDLKQEAANFSEMEDKKKIEQFMDQIKEARDRCQRYELLKQAPSNAEFVYAAPSEIVVSNSFCEKKTVLIGIDGPKSKLLNYLKKEQNKLKVVTIHGSGGLGKTALAMEIYGDFHIKAQFECQAFVSVGRTTSVRTALIEILRQVKSVEDAIQFRSCNEISIELWGYLLTKRYFICIDDIQCAEDSKLIFCALPDNNLGSRILTTTCLKDIAMACSSRPNDDVHEMIALDTIDSKSLFCYSVCVQEEEWSDHFKECSNKMLEVCGGMPLAIILTAGLLGTRTSAEVSVQLSQELKKTILSEFDQFDSLSQVMRKILHISYGDLPLPLKSCFLYLAVFSGNCNIKKDRLIRRWIAEGLVPESLGKSSCETGESYFHELIRRRLIQPVFDDEDDQPIGCTIHGVVSDFMEFLSREENFVAAVAKLESLPLTCDRVRRVSLDFGDKEGDNNNLILDTYCPLDQKSSAASSSDVSSSSDEDDGETSKKNEHDDGAVFLHLSRVRSLSFSGDAGRIPDLSAFKHVRVLDLEDTMGLENKQLESIRYLSLLRYLGLCGTDVTKLHEGIVALKLLSTLDLRRTSVRNLPEFRNKKLMSLLGDQLVLQRGMEGMQMLEQVSRVLLGPDGSTADSTAVLVHGLSRLKMLGVRFSHLHGQNETDRKGVKNLVEEVGKSNLESLLLDNYHQPLLGILASSLVANNSMHLKKFELRIRGCLPEFPQEEITSLKALTHLHINVEVVGAQAVDALGKLPNLLLLKLCANTSPSLTVRDGFQCLKVLWYNSHYSAGGGGGGGGVGFQFEVGAMPQLRRLRLDLDAMGTTPNKQDSFGCFGIQHLLNLAQLHVTIDWTKSGLTAPEVDTEEAHIREQVSRYPKGPVLELKRTRQRLAVAKAAEELVIAVHSLAEWSNRIDPNKLVVIHFTTGWCPASAIMAPVFSDLAKRFWNCNVVFLEVDIEANDETSVIAQQFYLDGVPTFIFIKRGSNVDRVVGGGVEKKKELEDKLVALLYSA